MSGDDPLFEPCEMCEIFGGTCPYHQGFCDGWDSAAEVLALLAANRPPVDLPAKGRWN